MSPDENIVAESALRPDALRRLRSIGHADLVIGITTYKNARTVGHVMQTAAQGAVHHFPGLRTVVVVVDGMSTDETMQSASQTALPRGVEKIVTLYQGLSGKGSAVRAVLEMASALKARACLLLDADLRSITPEWVYYLANPVLREDVEYVTPVYSRHRNEVTINDSLAYPLTRMLFGVEVRQPLGGEVALSRDLFTWLLSRDVWETDVARFGIHIWITSMAISEGWRTFQVRLGTKTHDFRDPTIGFEPKFLQVVGTLFRMLSIYRRVWPGITEIQPVPVGGIDILPEPEPVAPMRDSLREAVRKGGKRFKKTWAMTLAPANLAAVQELVAQDQPQFPFDLWARVVLDFAVVYNKGEGDPDKVVMALLPLYYARKLGWIALTDGLTYAEMEALVQEEADAFMAHQAYLLKRWSNYLPWEGDDYE